MFKGACCKAEDDSEGGWAVCVARCTCLEISGAEYAGGLRSWEERGGKMLEGGDFVSRAIVGVKEQVEMCTTWPRIE